jgi:hypothetical protein
MSVGCMWNETDNSHFTLNFIVLKNQNQDGCQYGD